MRRFALGLAVALFGLSSAQAQEAMPDRRYVVTRDIDYVGKDLQELFDTTLDACQQACLDAEGCIAFTFNSRTNACFPKSEVTDRAAYEGAVSGRVATTPPEVLARAETRRQDLDFLRDTDIDRARAEDLVPVTTEKDAVRLSRLNGPIAELKKMTRVLPVDLVFENQVALKDLIADVARRYHKRRISRPAVSSDP